MTPRPLYRSLTLWSGIFIMAFIAWAWRDSMKATSFSMVSPVTVFSECGSISIEKGPNTGTSRWGRDIYSGVGALPAVGFPPPSFTRGAAAPGPVPPQPGQLFHEWAREKVTIYPTDCWLLMIPHWMILLGVALGWSSLLILRLRRHRAAEASGFIAKAEAEASP